MKNNKLHKIKNPGFKIPKDYFEGLDNIILNQAKLMDSVEETGFSVPDGYFENLDIRILSKTQQEAKVISLFTKRSLAYAASFAAILVFSISILWNPWNNESDLEIAEIEQYLLQQDVSEFDLASLLTEQDLIDENFIELDISEENLEAYLLENTSLEDLLID